MDFKAIYNLPDYRRKHLLFDFGKQILGVPLIVSNVSNLTTVRLKQTEKPWPWPIDKKHGLDMCKATIHDLKRPLNDEQITYLESSRIGLDYIKIEVDIDKYRRDEEAFKDFPNYIVIDETANEISSYQEQRNYENLQWEILPSPMILDDFFIF